ncbi:MAG TPA: ribosome maturation factor RimM, partial [Tissierellaceae bacterium]|nr:ribosome maturation factor RimM [Tissierellaceae bacterium]
VYPLPEGYYYHFQLEGMDVYDDKLGHLGKLTDVLETGANDVYIVKSEKYGEILIPAIKQVIKAVDVETNIMRVELLEGLIDE